ncbi:MAG: PAS domain-containing sensor histidine kinase [Lysobacteraceae bacterium]|nr:MAG: PAS domain-containing sensor histidine kinase [Xanthomonadaceae bacterium]
MIELDNSILIDAMQTAVVVLSAERSVLRVNTAAADLLGVSRQRLLGMVHEGSPLHPLVELADRALNAHQTIIERELTLQSGPRRTTVIATANRVDTASGPVALVELTPLDWYIEHESIKGQRRRQSATRELARGLAHEVRNALGGINGASQLLRRQVANEEATRCLDVVQRETSRLGTLVDRVVASATPTPTREVELSRLLEEAREVVVAQFGEKVRIDRDYDPSIPPIALDGDRFKEAVLNLMLNSVQAGAGTVTLRTRIEHGRRLASTRHDTVIRIDVRDDGCGVDPSLRELMFYPLVTGRADGTGLGLSLAQSVATEHGGLIVYDALDPGSCFTFYLPFDPT